MEKNTKWYLLLIFTFIIWGTQHPPIKILSGEIPPFLFNFLRFLIAGLFLLPFIMRQKKVPEKKDLLKISLLGIVGISLYGFFAVAGIKLSTATNSAILINSSPLLIAILAPSLVKESMTIKKALGIILGFIGMFLVISNGFNILDTLKSEYFIGNLLLFTSALCLTIYAIYNKGLIKKYGGLCVTFYAILAGTVALFVFSFLSGQLMQIANISLNSFLLMAYVAIITTALTWVIWFNAINKKGVINTSSFFFLMTLSGIVSSNLVLGEKLTDFIITGAILILLGIYIVQKE